MKIWQIACFNFSSRQTIFKCQETCWLMNWLIQHRTHCCQIQKFSIFGAQRLKITEKVSFNIASEASYVYFIKNAKNGQFWRVFEIMKLTVKQCFQKGQKLADNAQNWNETFWIIFKHCVVPHSSELLQSTPLNISSPSK